jgi:hypothetical protein
MVASQLPLALVVPKALKTVASQLFLVFRFKSVYESKLSTHPLNEKPALFVRAL